MIRPLDAAAENSQARPHTIKVVEPQLIVIVLLHTHTLTLANRCIVVIHHPTDHNALHTSIYKLKWISIVVA